MGDMEKRITLRLVRRRFLLWLLICGVSAAPSFVMAVQNGGNTAGMVLGVLMFVIGYTLVTSTRPFQRFYSRPFIRTTMRLGYGLRLLLSALTAGVMFDVIFPIVPDLFCGYFSVLMGSAILRIPEQELIADFRGALVVTCIQGALLNAVVGVAMAIFYAILRAFGKPTIEPRGFEVVPLASAREES